jgi:hypothetical protein
VNWTLFDFVCLDYYPAQVDPLAQQPCFAHGKPVVITEVGCCTYQGTEDKGGMRWSVIDQRSMPAQNLDGDHTRDERLQARTLAASLARLDSAGVDGCFVYTFIIPALTHSEDPRKDLDMASYGLVKSLGRGQAPPAQACLGNRKNPSRPLPTTSPGTRTEHAGTAGKAVREIPGRSRQPYAGPPFGAGSFKRKAHRGLMQMKTICTDV